MLWFSILSCSFFSSPPKETIDPNAPYHFILLSIGDEDIVENIASALSYKNMAPEIILYDKPAKEYASNLQKQLPKAQLKLWNTNLSPIQSFSISNHNIAMVSVAPQQLIPQSPQLEDGSYIAWQSSQSWPLFFENSKEIISPLHEKAVFALEDVPEPSGLAIHPKTKNLWTVSDETGQIFDLGIQANDPQAPHSHEAFRIQQYEENDLEGIAFINGSLCVIVESERRLICYDESFTEVSNQRVEGPYDPKEDNKGPEGLSDDGIILNEGYPTAIANTGHILHVGSDVSGIEKTDTHYWILSQSDGTITKLDLNFKPIHTYNFPDAGLEGISIYENSIFLISDPVEVLYQVELPN